MSQTIITIDPGQKGGIAVRWPDGRTVTHAMPATDADTLDLLREIVTDARRESWPVRAFLEKVGGYIGQQQPGSAMFKFGESYGFLLGVLMALQVRVILVRPQQWQAALQLGHAGNFPSKPAWKRHLRAEAARRFPEQHPTLSTADALLMLDAANLILALPPAPGGADTATVPNTHNETKGR